MKKRSVSNSLLKRCLLFCEDTAFNYTSFRRVMIFLTGLHYSRPPDMTRLEWDQELHDFQNVLPPDLRSLILEVERQQKPLARPDIAAPIADVLKSKFVSNSSSCSGKVRELFMDETFL